jgi:hypothetical protein
MRPTLPPRYGAAGYERVGFALLLAATPPELASDYNKRRGELWGRLQALRTVPRPAEFERLTHVLRDYLRAAAAPRGGHCTEAVRHELVRAARRLDLMEEAARDAGLLG